MATTYTATTTEISEVGKHVSVDGGANPSSRMRFKAATKGNNGRVYEFADDAGIIVGYFYLNGSVATEVTTVAVTVA